MHEREQEQSRVLAGRLRSIPKRKLGANRDWESLRDTQPHLRRDVGSDQHTATNRHSTITLLCMESGARALDALRRACRNEISA